MSTKLYANYTQFRGFVSPSMAGFDCDCQDCAKPGRLERFIDALRRILFG